jgi:hypothetical protein
LIDEGVAMSRHHIATTHIFDIEESRASAHSYFHVLTPSGMDHWGSYSDEVVRVDGQWLIAHRRVAIDGHSPTSWRHQLRPWSRQCLS